MRRQPGLLARFSVIAQFIRFAIVGFLNVAVSFLVFFACYKIWPVATIILGTMSETGAILGNKLGEVGASGIDATFANIVGYTAGILNSFILNKLWTFRAQGRLVRQLRRFMLLNILGLGISTLIIFLFVDLLKGPYLFVWFVSIGVVLVLNFFGQKHWAFSEGLPYKATH